MMKSIFMMSMEECENQEMKSFKWSMESLDFHIREFLDGESERSKKRLKEEFWSVFDRFRNNEYIECDYKLFVYYMEDEYKIQTFEEYKEYLFRCITEFDISLREIF